MKSPYSYYNRVRDDEGRKWVHLAGAGMLIVALALVWLGRHYGFIWDGSDCVGWFGPCASAR